MTILTVKNISKRFGASEVLNNIGFSLDEGETLAIIGASGSGKTTLLRCMNFLERPDAGTISVRGEVIFDADKKDEPPEEIRKKRLHFGLVFQAFNLFPQYTAFENIVLARELAVKKTPGYKNNKKDMLEAIHNDGADLLEQVGLTDKRGFYPYQLSGGQQQRVAIARALALRPDILCFDEPTSALDPELTGEVLRVIKGLASNNKTMIIVTHEMQFARDVSDKILFMDAGLVVEYGAPSDVLVNPANERTKKFLKTYYAT